MKILTAAYPLPFDLSVPILKNLPVDARVLAHVKLPYTTQGNERFASIHSNPPGIMTGYPAVVYREIGKGRVLFSAMPIEKEPVGVYGRILRNLLYVLGLKLSLTATAPASVELVTFDTAATRTVGTVTLDQDQGPVAPFAVSMPWQSRPQRVRRISSGEELPFVYENGVLRFQTGTLDIFDLYEITR